MDMFEQASREKLRFPSAKGQLTVEDLWDLPLTAKEGNASLDNIAKSLNHKLKSSEGESFVLKTQRTDSATQLSFDIVKHVISVRLAEAEQALQARAKREQKEVIRDIIEQKKAQDLQGKSIEELETLAKSL